MPSIIRESDVLDEINAQWQAMASDEWPQIGSEAQAESNGMSAFIASLSALEDDMACALAGYELIPCPE